MAQTAGGTVQTGKKSEAIPNISNTVGTEQEYKRQKSEQHPMDLPAHLAERCRWLSEGKKPLGEGPDGDMLAPQHEENAPSYPSS